MSELSRFEIIAEKIHCTRTYKSTGAMVTEVEPGRFGIAYSHEAEKRMLPIPDDYLQSADWGKGKVRHCAVAVDQGMNRTGAGRASGIDFIRSMAASQAKGGAAYIDINIDEYSTDNDVRTEVVAWVVGQVQEACAAPVSIDSSDVAVLRAGLKACTDPARGRPMVNSVSLERADAVALAEEFEVVVVASAAGEKGLPSTLEERMANLEHLMPKLRAVGLTDDQIYVDPLVLPIATDAVNGRSCIDTVAAIRERYGPAIHITGGFSNVSFGMPNRKLINQVFTRLCVDAGADSGIVDPLHINPAILAGLDFEAEDVRLARDLLVGDDEYGMNYIAASRDGRI